MLVAIISDVHNNEINLQKVLDYCTDQKIGTIICCGDLASEETMEFMNDSFSGKIYFTAGNMDAYQLGRYLEMKTYGQTDINIEFGEIEIDGKKIAFVHYPQKARKLCESEKYDFVFYGHTHKPWEETIGSCKMLNPGNVAGEIYPPTFAVWDTENDKFSLIRVHDL